MQWLFCVALGAGVLLLPGIPLVFQRPLTWWTFPLLLLAAGARFWMFHALLHNRPHALLASLGALIVGAGLTYGLSVERIINERKSNLPVIRMLDELTIPHDALWGYDLSENAEGVLCFYGYRPRRLPDLDQAAPLAKLESSTFILCNNRGTNSAEASHLAERGWSLRRYLRCANWSFWLMANPAAAGR